MQNQLRVLTFLILAFGLSACSVSDPFGFFGSQPPARQGAYPPIRDPFFRKREPMGRQPRSTPEAAVNRNTRYESRTAPTPTFTDTPRPEPSPRATPRPTPRPTPTPSFLPTPSATTSPTGGAGASEQILYGIPVPGKPGYVTSPYSPDAGYVDVTGLAPGSKAQDPYSGKVFRVP